MASARSWLPLPLEPSSSLPVLLVSLDLGTVDYTILVTDMANMWSESLDRKAICIRAWSENTTIDPSDTAENMTKFLSSLKTALDPAQPGHDETSLDLSPASQSHAGEDGLTLKITRQLPGLPAFKWPMYLKKSPPSAIATDLTLPLIEAQLAKMREVDSLVKTLIQKDTAMTKLLDKLEAMGTGLEHVFNQLSGTKKVTRAAAADKVPGLATFDRRRWKSKMAEDEVGPDKADALVREVFGGQGLQYQPTMEIDNSPGLDKWWHSFSATSHHTTRSQANPATPKEATPPQAESRDADDDEDDDEFQIQSTPPHLKSKRHSTAAQRRANSENGSTEGTADTLPLAPSSAALSSETHGRPETRRPGPRLGTLDRKKQPTPTRSPSPMRIPSRVKARSPIHDESETASEAGDEGATASLPHDEAAPSPSPPPKPMPKKGGLGRIGGPKPIPSTKKPVATPESDHDQTSSRGTIFTAPKKLGVIGKKKASGEVSIKEGVDDRGRKVTMQHKEDKSPEAKRRETSQERADRNRQELKRDLEKKVAAGPAKKKRKF